MYLCKLKLTTMKSPIFFFLFLTCQFLANGQTYNTTVIKESIENYYAKKKSAENFKFIKSEITSVSDSYVYVSDSLGTQGIENVIRKTCEEISTASTSEAKKEALSSIVVAYVGLYFRYKDKYLTNDKSKLYLVKGNILYSITENYQKKNLYENFYMFFNLDYKIISHHVVD